MLVWRALQLARWHQSLLHRYSPILGKPNMKTKNTIAIALAFAFGGVVTPVIAAGGGGVVADPGAMQGKHFDPKIVEVFLSLQSTQAE